MNTHKGKACWHLSLKIPELEQRLAAVAAASPPPDVPAASAPRDRVDPWLTSFS